MRLGGGEYDPGGWKEHKNGFLRSMGQWREEWDANLGFR